MTAHLPETAALDGEPGGMAGELGGMAGELGGMAGELGGMAAGRPAMTLEDVLAGRGHRGTGLRSP